MHENWTGTLPIAGSVPTTCVMKCTADFFCFVFDFFQVGGFSCDLDGCNGASIEFVRLVSSACDPFQLVFDGNATSGPPCNDMKILGCVITIDAPGLSSGFPACCQTFHATGCGGRDISGATVSVYSASGGTLLASGTTSAAGLVTLWWSGSCDAYATATDAGGRLVGYGSSLSATATGTTVLSMLPAASGHTCHAACGLPLSDTLHVSFPSAGSQTMTASGGVWTSSFSFSGHAYVITLTGATNAMTITRDGVSCGTTFFVATACPPAFAATLVLPAGTCKSELGGNGTATE